jgi:hypothetical protein
MVTRAEAEIAIDLFTEAYQARYPKAVECVRKDQRALLAFYDWPAEHWILWTGLPSWGPREIRSHPANATAICKLCDRPIKTPCFLHKRDP